MHSSYPTRRALVLSAAAIASGARAAAEEPPLARTRQGLVRGVRGDGVVAFKGVPYAAPPVGPLRFRPPAPPAPWAGIRDAIAFAAAPIQPPPPPGVSPTAYLGADTSEDCLYLNIWRPETAGPHPVFVWIHGGGNMAGSAAQLTDGAVFARSDVVCVTIGYRVGAFGFLELGRILGDSYRGSGVNGLRDQIAALAWIKANIAAFGGDPRRVTIGGASAGGKNVVTLMASPLARGLFTSAIVESGGQTTHDLCSAEHVADLMLHPLDATARASLPSLAADQLNTLQIALLPAYERPFPFRAVVGTDVAPLAPLDALGRDPALRRRLLIGTNRDESISFISRRSAEGPVAQHDLSNMEVAAARSIAAGYDRLFAALDPLHRRVRFVSAEEYVVPSIRVAEAVRPARDVWCYRFERPMAGGPFAGWAPHGGEALYVWQAFDNPLARAVFGAATPDVWRLSEEVHARWCAFIRGDAPEATGHTVWPRYNGSDILVFGEEGSHAGQVDKSELALWVDAPFDGAGACRSGAPA